MGGDIQCKACSRVYDDEETHKCLGRPEAASLSRQVPPPWFDSLTPAQRRGAWCLRERMRVIEYLQSLSATVSALDGARLLESEMHWEYVPGETFDERWAQEVEKRVGRKVRK